MTIALRILRIPGDGIGRDVIDEAVKVVNKAIEFSKGELTLEWDEVLWGCEYYVKTGVMMPNDALEVLCNYDAALFGAVGWPALVDNNISLEMRLKWCRAGRSICLRPTRILPGVNTWWKSHQKADFVFVRENSEGEYGPYWHILYEGDSEREMAVQTSTFSRRGCEDVITYAFQLARRRAKQRSDGKKPRVTGLTKSNALGSMSYWDNTFRRIARMFPDVDAELMQTDAMAARMITNPELLDVVVATNLHGDILTDQAAAMAGSMGLAASANLSPDGSIPGVYEPVHGSAPDIAGKGIANPIAAIWSAVMMLEDLGATNEAAMIMNAIMHVTANGQVTPDLGGNLTTTQVGDAICNALTPITA